MNKSNQLWNTKLYDDKHKFVSQYGSDLVNLLSPQAGEYILDLGCGTGDLANEMSSSGAKIIGIDASKDMIIRAIKKYPNIKFEVMDATNIEFENKFDAVFSNAVLHWIKTPKQVLESTFSVLSRKGRFVTEFGGKGNCQLITSTIIDVMKDMNYYYNMDDFPWYFPSIGEYSSLMEEVGFEVVYAIHFERPTKLMDKEYGLRGWITMFAGKLFTNVPEEELEIVIQQVESRLKDELFENGDWYADYKRIRVIGIKS